MIERINQLTNHFNQKILAFDLQTIDKNNNGILSGRLGLIYYFFNMYKINSNDIYLTKISELLESVFENSNDKNNKISNELDFSDGLCGLGFILNELIHAEILDANYNEQLSVINELAMDYAIKKIAQGNFDFFYGAVGGLYYLSEVNKLDYCETIIDELFKVAPNNNFLYNSKNEDEYNRGVNFGLAHGNTALFIVLINLVQKGLKNKSLITLIDKGVRELLKYESEEYIEGENIKIYFPHNLVIEKETVKINRSIVLGWCNSELDIALLIQKYSETMENQDFLHLSSKIGLETTKRQTEYTTGVYDYHFCHGSSGIAQLYYKLFEQTKIEAYDKADKYWLNETINFLEKEKDEQATTSKINFLYGWPAALLTLNTRTNQKIQGWDKLFLI